MALSSAQQVLVSNNVRVAFKAASLFQSRAIRMGWQDAWDADKHEELSGVACLALCKAVLGFDESKGFKFSTYAFKCCFSAMSRYSRKHYAKHKDDNDPNDDNQFVKLIMLANEVESPTDGGFTLESVQCHVSKVQQEDNEIDELIENRLSSLQSHESALLREYFWGDKTLEQIGTELKITKQGVKYQIDRLCRVLESRLR